MSVARLASNGDLTTAGLLLGSGARSDLGAPCGPPT